MSNSLAKWLLQTYMNFLIMASNGYVTRSMWDWLIFKNLVACLFLEVSGLLPSAILRLAGVRVTSHNIHLTPAAFSFGWLGFTLAALIASLRGKPTMGEYGEGIQVINIDEGKVSKNKSWLIEKLLDDSEQVRLKQVNEDLKRRQHDSMSDATEKTINSTGDQEEISLLIDILTTESHQNLETAKSYLWWLCWAVIPFQLLIASIPYQRHNDSSILLITTAGILLSIITSSIPHWARVKWPAGRVPDKKSKTIALTRGRARRYIMLVYCEEGSLDLDLTSTASVRPSWWTTFALLILTACWTYLPFKIAILQGNKYYIAVIGLVGWLQNLQVGTMSATPDELNVHLHRSEDRLSITTYQRQSPKGNTGFWKTKPKPEDEPARIEARNAWIKNVVKSLIELEKHHKSAGSALVSVFFPDPVEYEDVTSLSEEERQFLHTAAAVASAVGLDVDGKK